MDFARANIVLNIRFALASCPEVASEFLHAERTTFFILFRQMFLLYCCVENSCGLLWTHVEKFICLNCRELISSICLLWSVPSARVSLQLRFYVILRMGDLAVFNSDINSVKLSADSCSILCLGHRSIDM